MNVRLNQAVVESTVDCSEITNGKVVRKAGEAASDTPNWAWAVGNREYDWMNFHVPSTNSR